MEMVSKKKDDQYYEIDMKVQIEQDIVSVQKKFNCVQSLKADFGSGVTETWTAEPLFTTIDDKKGGFWFLRTPCDESNLSKHPRYIAHFADQSDTYPQIYTLLEDGPFKVILGGTIRLTEEPDKSIGSNSTKYSKENLLRLTPFFLNAYISNTGTLNENLTKLGISSDSEITFIGSPRLTSKNYVPNEITKSISNKPKLVMTRHHQLYANELAFRQVRAMRNKSTRVPLSYDNGLWVLKGFPLERPNYAFDAFTREKEGDLVIEYKGYQFSPDEVALIYDSTDNIIISFHNYMTVCNDLYRN